MEDTGEKKEEERLYLVPVWHGLGPRRGMLYVLGKYEEKMLH